MALDQIVNGARRLESFLWDAWMRVDTAHTDDASVVQGAHHDSHEFQTNSHLTIRSVIRRVRPGAEDTVIVAGCAKGRALCHFARLKVRKVIGIEISSRLAGLARENVTRLRGRRAPVEILNADAALADFSEGTLIYMFNPFGEATLRHMLQNVERSRLTARKPLTIIYVNPRFAGVFAEFAWLEKQSETRRFTGLRAVVYQARRQIGAP
jgi:SAM-dependent methyltransferase